MSAVLDRPRSHSTVLPKLPDGRVSIYEPQQPGLIYPQLPEFANVTEERLHLKQRLVAACRALARRVLIMGLRDI